MECKCCKKDPIWIVFVHYLTPRELRKDFKGKKRENENSTEMESVYLLLFVSTNHCYLIFFWLFKKIEPFFALEFAYNFTWSPIYFFVIFAPQVCQYTDSRYF